MARTLPAPTRDAVVGPDGLITGPWADYFGKLTGVDGYVFERPSCLVYRATVQTISTGTETDVLWTVEDHDNYSMHDISTNTDRITIPETGKYAFGAHLLWEGHATGYRQMIISLNDAAPTAVAARILEHAANANTFPSNIGRNHRSATRDFDVGDILRVVAQQNSGGDLDILETTTDGPMANGFWCFKVSN